MRAASCNIAITPFVLREGMLVFQGSAEECLRDEETIKSYLGVH